MFTSRNDSVIFRDQQKACQNHRWRGDFRLGAAESVMVFKDLTAACPRQEKSLSSRLEEKREMKRVLFVAGIVLVLLGLLWALQGMGLVGGSFMTNQTKWIYLGGLAALAGLVLLVQRRRVR